MAQTLISSVLSGKVVYSHNALLIKVVCSDSALRLVQGIESADRKPIKQEFFNKISPKHATLQYAPRYEISCNAVIRGKVLRLRMMNSCDRNVSSSIWRNYCSGCVDTLSA